MTRGRRFALRLARGLPLLVPLCAVSLWLTLLAFSSPLEVRREITDLQVQAETTFTHQVLPVTSALFPNPEPLENEPHFYMRLLDRLTLQVDSVLAIEPAAAVEGTTRIDVKVVAPGRWERSFPLRPPQRFRHTEPVEQVEVFKETILVNLEEYQEFISVVEEETRMMPLGDYQIVVVPAIEVTAQHGGQTVANVFEFSYPFVLAGSMLTAEGQRRQTDAAAATHTITEPGTLPVAGLILDVRMTRAIGAVISALLLALTAIGLRAKLATRAAISEAERIRRRHRMRLVEVRTDERIRTAPLIKLATYRDLQRLADHLDQTILMTRNGTKCRFFVVADQMVYMYEAAEQTLNARSVIAN